VTDALFVVDDSRGKVWRVSATVQGVRLGIRIGSARDGKVTAFIPALGPEVKPTSTTEGSVVDAAGNLYAGETGTRNLRKYVKK
jgi:hypothetical protein